MEWIDTVIEDDLHGENLLERLSVDNSDDETIDREMADLLGKNLGRLRSESQPEER